MLPAWLTCLSATAEPDEYARRVVEVIENHESRSPAKCQGGCSCNLTHRHEPISVR